MAGLTQKIYRTLRKVKCDLRRDVSCFTPALAVAHALCDLPLRGPVFQPVGRWAAKRRDAAIFDYLDQNYGAFFETFARQWAPPEKKECSGPAPIWVCWLQGEEQAPKLVRRCIASIRKNANGHPVNLLTEENIGRYLSIPRGILQKYRHGRNRASPLCGYCPHDVAERVWRAMAGCHNFMHKACTGLVFSEVVFFL